MIIDKTIPAPTVFDNFFSSLAPTYYPNNTVTPVVNPKTKFVIKDIT